VTVVVSIAGAADAVKYVVSDSMESNEVSKSGDARDGLVGVVMG
jgi:hypothetical protein